MVKIEYFRYIGVFSSVILTLATAFSLSYAAKNFKILSLHFTVILSMVILLNISKFIIWGKLNKRFDLSKTYPLTAIFFPLIFIISIMTGDSKISTQKIIGLILIFLGVYFFDKYSIRN